MSGFTENVGKLFQSLSSKKEQVYTNRNNPKKILGFFGAVGDNVGATTLAVNTAVSLSAYGRVCVLDLNVQQPNCFRYLFQKEEEEGCKNLLDKFANIADPICEYITQATDYDNINLATVKPFPRPMDYSNMEIPAIKRVFDELLPLFDFIIVDSGTDLNYETAEESIRNCFTTFGVVPPMPHSIERLSGLNQFLSTAGLPLLENVIESVVHENIYISREEAKEFGINIAGIFPYSSEVLEYCKRYTPFVDKKLKTETAIACKDVCDSIAQAIVDGVRGETSDN